MKYTFLFVFLLCISMAGCDERLMNRKVAQEEYSTKGLLDSLHLNVASRNPLLIKYANIDGEEDSTQLNLDSAGWSREFQIFNDMKVQPARLQGRYLKVVNKDDSLIHTKYMGKDPDHLQLDSFFVTTNHKHELINLKAFINYSNSLNSTQQQLNMDFIKLEDDLLPVFYKTEGWQKLTLKDTVNFLVESKLSY